MKSTIVTVLLILTLVGQVTAAPLLPCDMSTSVSDQSEGKGFHRMADGSFMANGSLMADGSQSADGSLMANDPAQDKTDCCCDDSVCSMFSCAVFAILPQALEFSIDVASDSASKLQINSPLQNIKLLFRPPILV